MRIAALLIAAVVMPHCATAAASAGENRSAPEIRSPQDGQRIGEPGDPQCEPKRPCFRIRAEGWVPAGRFAFLAVSPVNASPRVWIQPPIHGVRTDGKFSGLVYLGEAHNGAREWFKIFAVACGEADRFRDGEEIIAFPDDCEVSEPVEVYRER